MKRISLVLGTRGSTLALAQTETVRARLMLMFPELKIETRIIKTEGDIDRTSPLSDFGGRGAFVRSIENALLLHKIDAAVHSLKDLPSKLPEGLVLGAAPERADYRDVLVSPVGHTLKTLPSGSVIATGSIRRRVQIRAVRPDVVFADIRGNIETRLKKPGHESVDAVVLAAAGLERLGLSSAVTEYLDTETVLPAPCQGALGLECRADDPDVLSLLNAIDDRDVRACVETERAFIETLGMGCHMPVGALARFEGREIVFSGFVSPAGHGDMMRETIHATPEQAQTSAREMAGRLRRAVGNNGKK
ncbi:hydroxymethylbilane synthase [bacterium]|nr:hydroxymethylbilane synthase [bacterium]